MPPICGRQQRHVPLQARPQDLHLQRAVEHDRVQQPLQSRRCRPRTAPAARRASRALAPARPSRRSRRSPGTADRGTAAPGRRPRSPSGTALRSAERAAGRRLRQAAASAGRAVGSRSCDASPGSGRDRRPVGRDRRPRALPGLVRVGGVDAHAHRRGRPRARRRRAGGSRAGPRRARPGAAATAASAISSIATANGSTGRPSMRWSSEVAVALRGRACRAPAVARPAPVLAASRRRAASASAPCGQRQPCRRRCSPAGGRVRPGARQPGGRPDHDLGLALAPAQQLLVRAAGSPARARSAATPRRANSRSSCGGDHAGRAPRPPVDRARRARASGGRARARACRATSLAAA